MNIAETAIKDKMGYNEALISISSNQNQWPIIGSYRKAFRLIFISVAVLMGGIAAYELALVLCTQPEPDVVLGSV